MIWRSVQTMHPPAIGVWLYFKPGIDVERIDAAVHLWLMRELLKAYEDGA